MSWDTLKRFWDWVDERDIDKHVLSIAVMVSTFKITAWAITYAMTCTKPGAEVAMIIAAVLVPWTPLQAAALKWQFERA